MRPTRAALFTTFAFALILAATPLQAQTSSVFTAPPATESYAGPKGILPSSLFDPSRFSISHSMQFGYTAGGATQGSAGLWTSSLGYRVRNNTMLRVDVGAHMNPAFGGEGGMQKGIFLQGATLDWKPSRNSLVRLEYRDMRSPLQYGYGYGGYGYANPAGYGYGSPHGGSLLGPEDVTGTGLPGDPTRN